MNNTKIDASNIVFAAIYKNGGPWKWDETKNIINGKVFEENVHLKGKSRGWVRMKREDYNIAKHDWENDKN